MTLLAKIPGKISAQCARSITSSFMNQSNATERSFSSLVIKCTAPTSSISSVERYLEPPPHARKVRLPESRVLYTVLRSPHIDKKSREQFQMEIQKQIFVVKTQRHELRKKLFWLKRQRILGAQYEIQLSCKTRLDKEKLKSLL